MDFQSYQFLKVWHYHPEPELAIILHGNGTLYLGDGMKKFKPGDIVLIGGNLPHQWQMEDSTDKRQTLQTPTVVIHFMESFTHCLMQIPEFNRIRALFDKSNKGILFTDIDFHQVLAKVDRLKSCQDFDRVIMVLDILKLLENSGNQEILSCNNFFKENDNFKENKLEKLYSFIEGNFKEGISLESAAGIVNMNPSSFSRYFKRIHQKTFVRYLNEIKIGYACRLLMEKETNISEACYESGFKNISNFNRKFKEIKKVSPSQFLKNRNYGSE